MINKLYAKLNFRKGMKLQVKFFQGLDGGKTTFNFVFTKGRCRKLSEVPSMLVHLSQILLLWFYLWFYHTRATKNTVEPRLIALRKILHCVNYCSTKVQTVLYLKYNPNYNTSLFKERKVLQHLNVRVLSTHSITLASILPHLHHSQVLDWNIK